MLKIKKVRPLYNRIITTAEVYGVDELEGVIIDPKKMQGTLKEYQKVLAVGDSVRGIKVDDLVKIDPTAYAVKKYKDNTLKDGVIQSNPVITYNFNTMILDGKNCLVLYDRDIEYVIEESEEVHSHIIQKENGIAY